MVTRSRIFTAALGLVILAVPDLLHAQTGVRVVRLDLGVHHTRVQPAWTAWSLGKGGHWNHRGPFTKEIPSTAFAPGSFTVTLGPEKGIGYRAGPACTGSQAAVIEENAFSWSDRPLKLTLSGLATGTYRLITWHNDSRGYVRPPIDILATDARGKEREAVMRLPQTGTTEVGKAARADFLIHSDGENDILIQTRVKVAEHVYVSLNGIEIYAADAVTYATSPAPANSATDISTSPGLSWRPAPGVDRHHVLLGPTAAELRCMFEDEADTTCEVAGLEFGKTYIWRVDAITEQGTMPGEPWSFKTFSGQAANPTPRSGAHEIPPNATLAWHPARGASSHDLYMGTSPDALRTAERELSAPRVDLTDLDLSTTYHWRVDEHHGDTVIQGPVWTFRTEEGRVKHVRPVNGARDVDPSVEFSWYASGNASSYNVWLGPSPDALSILTTGLSAPPLPYTAKPDQTLFWRVDAIYGNDTIKGPIHSFSTGSVRTIDDMESYTRTQRLSDVWVDGRADAANGARARLSDDGTNALVIKYDLSAAAGRSQATVSRGFAPPRDWAAFSAGALHLALYRPLGQAAPALLVTLQDSAGRQSETVVENGQSKPGEWKHCTAPMSAFRGIDLAQIKSISIGLQPPAAAGTTPTGEIMIDDIELTTAEPVRVEYHVGRLDTIRGAAPAPAASSADEPRRLRCDVCVVGGGSGGIGTAVAAARAGASVIVVERQNVLGGTSTAGYVTNWEPGPGSSIAREIYERLARYQHGVIIDRPSYDKTLTRASRGHVCYEIAPFHEVVMSMLEETGCARVLLNTSCTAVHTDQATKHVAKLETEDDSGRRFIITAAVFVDCTGGGYLCQAAGCEAMLGADAKSRFNEPEAPDEPKNRLNAIELGYRIRPSDTPERQPLPAGHKPRKGGYAYSVPSGNRMVNSCGGLGAGWELIELGYEGMMKTLKERVRAHWHWMQEEKFPGYEFDSYAPMLAIRESYRIVGEYVLTQHDLLAGIEKQPHHDIIAIADHPMDTHGSGGGLQQVATPYGIPYRCLVPKGGWTNLLIACRGASFSHLAASSCRLSRTIMALGQAAGLAAAQSVESCRQVSAVDVQAIQDALELPEQVR